MQGHPRTLGRFEVRNRLGGGGFGTVYRADDPALESDVALKLLHPELARDPEIRRRFTREGSALRRVRHPNIVHVYDVGLYDSGEGTGIPYLVMELVEGRPLSAILREHGPLPLTAERIRHGSQSQSCRCSGRAGSHPSG